MNTETKKTKLIGSLKLAIDALKNSTIHYDWLEQDSCNCGVVAQAILGKSRKQIDKLFTPVSNKIDSMNKENNNNKLERTWKQAVGLFCPITGEPMFKVFQLLFEAGLTKSDIVHLEYMENPAILKKSGIKHERKIFFGLKKVKVPGFYKNKQNLILYLQAWVEILEEGSQYSENSNWKKVPIESLNSELINAIADENYEKAAVLRDEIALQK